MKRIVLGIVKIKSVPQSVARQLMLMVENTKINDQPIMLEGMRKRLKLLDKIEAANEVEMARVKSLTEQASQDQIDRCMGYLDLEDADWDFLKQLVESTSYNFADRGLVEISERVTEAKAPEDTVLPSEKPTAEEGKRLN